MQHVDVKPLVFSLTLVIQNYLNNINLIVLTHRVEHFNAFAFHRKYPYHSPLLENCASYATISN